MSKRLNMKRVIISAGLIGLTLFWVSCDSSISPNEQSKDDSPYSEVTADAKTLQHVLRLNIQYRNGQFSVTEHRVMIANPTPVVQASDSAPLLVQTLSKNNKVLFSGGIHDPRFAELDIEDPGRSGVWQHKQITLSKSDFQLKIPINEDISELHIIDNHSGEELFRINIVSYLEGSK